MPNNVLDHGICPGVHLVIGLSTSRFPFSLYPAQPLIDWYSALADMKKGLMKHLHKLLFFNLTLTEIVLPHSSLKTLSSKRIYN